MNKGIKFFSIHYSPFTIHRFYYCALLLCTFFLETLLAPFPSAADDGGYLAQLIERAHRERLAERPEWRALLHYKPLLLSKSPESLVDADAFFLAPAGKNDPEAELDATLAAFFKTDEGDPDKCAQCTFAARYHWLGQALEFDPDRLPPRPCKRLRQWLEELNPSRLTLIFPSAYLNNPASMFGHTLLRIDAPWQDEQTRLLAYTINYAADTSQQRGVQFAFKGLFGMYHGRFSVAPYYFKVKAYGDIENRDIWEYRLNLTEAEIRQLLRHAWEMQSAWFDYYFFDENCSYQLLSLLETARPSLRLTDRFAWWAIPSETVRAVAEAGLVDEVRFRPARNTVLLERARLLDSRLQTLAKRLATDELEPAPDQMGDIFPVEQAQAIELALDYAAYRQSPRFGRAAPNAGLVSKLLKARSRLDAPDQTPVIPAPEIWPGAGHRPARVGIGYGYENRRQFLELTISPGYHELLDPEGGFTRGARVSGLNTALRYYPEENSAQLERIDVIDIMSLSSWNHLVRPVSWKAGVGVGRKYRSASGRPLLGRINGGVGLSHDFSRQTSAYAFAEGTLEWSDRFRYIVAPGVGSSMGILHDFSDRWRSGLFFLWQVFFLDEWRNDHEIVSGNRFTINRQNVAGLDLAWKNEFGNGYAGVKLYWQFYF